jgi:hypothetical protein
MSFKFSQSQIFTGVLVLTLGIISGALGYDYSLKYFAPKPNPQTSQTPTLSVASIPGSPSPTTTPNPISTPTQAETASTPNQSSTDSTKVSLNITEPEKAVTNQEPTPEIKKIVEPTGQTQTLKNLKITIDKVEYTSNTPFKDPKSQIKDTETFVLLSVTIENISDKTLSLDGRAYLIEIFDELAPKQNSQLEPKQVVYKPARELGPTFSQSKSTLIRYNFKSKQKFSGVVGFKIPKETKILNFYYPDVLESKDIALFRLK